VVRRIGAAAVMVVAVATMLAFASSGVQPVKRSPSAVTTAQHAVLVAASADPRRDPASLGLGLGLVAALVLALAAVLASDPVSNRRHPDRRRRWRARLVGAPPVLL